MNGLPAANASATLFDKALTVHIALVQLAQDGGKSVRLRSSIKGWWAGQ